MNIIPGHCPAVQAVKAVSKGVNGPDKMVERCQQILGIANTILHPPSVAVHVRYTLHKVCIRDSHITACIPIMIGKRKNCLAVDGVVKLSCKLGIDSSSVSSIAEPVLNKF